MVEQYYSPYFILRRLTSCCCVGQGVLGHTLSPVRQVFERIPSASAAADAESRFQHFKKHVWLRIKESGASGLFFFPASFFSQAHLVLLQEAGGTLKMRFQSMLFSSLTSVTLAGWHVIAH